MARINRNKARVRRHKRVRRRIHGTPERPRLCVYRSINEIYVQVIDDEAGKTLFSASTIDNELRKTASGKGKTEQAEIVGKAVADRAKKHGVSTVVFDRGGYKYIGRVKALAEAARKGGLEF